MKKQDISLEAKPNVLVYCRDYLIEDYQENLIPLKDEFNFSYLTDGNKKGITDTRKRFYDRIDTVVRPDILMVEVEKDILTRCRYLSNVPVNKAKKMLYAMTSVLLEELDKIKPDLIFSQMVDEYSTHLLAELAKQKKIMYIGFAYSYFAGKAHVTQFSAGVPFKLREPTNEEVLEIIEVISKNTFRQDYLHKDTYTYLRHGIAVLKYKVKSVIFNVMKVVKSDPLSMHYNCLPYVVERRFLNYFPSSADFHKEWSNLIELAKNNTHKKTIYFPLAYFPEATTNYWIENKKIIRYEEVVLEICQYLSKHYNLIVKEHLHMLGARNPSFYQKIKAIRDIISVPPQAFSNEVMANADAVFLGGGSVGVESFIRGKPILTYCNSSYWYPISGALYLNISDTVDWQEKIDHYLLNHEKPNSKKKEEFIKLCLGTTMSIKKPGKVWPICEKNHIRSLLKQAIK